MSTQSAKSKSSLTIIGQNRPGRALSEPELDQPRALRSLARIVDGGLCHRCGSCVGICPTDVLSLDKEDYPTVDNLSACTDCDLCVKVCPGDEFDYDQFNIKLFGNQGDVRGTHGQFSSALIAFSTDGDLRQASTSGGLVTGLLLHLLDTKQIDGAIVIASDENNLWKGRPVIARSREEILATAKSKYAISPTNSVFSEIRNVEGRYALVGLPCQIHGYWKAAELDARIKQRVVLTIGLFCHAAVEHEAFEVIWDSIGEKSKRAKSFVSRIGKHPGAPHIELDDGSYYPVYFGIKSGYRPTSMEFINVLYRLYTPQRCLTCFDATSEFADISIGDPWMAPPEDDINFYEGWSFALLRTKRGADAFKGLSQSGKVVHKPITKAEALTCNDHMAQEKRWRAFRIIETHKRQGKPVPAYGPHGLDLPRHSGWQFLKTEANILTHIFCYLPSLRKYVLLFALSNWGYWLLWINNKRRRVKFWIRDNIVRYKRKVFGRC